MSSEILLCQKRCCPRLRIERDEIIILDDTNINPPDEIHIPKTIWNLVIDKAQRGELQKL
jgi:hypothetical protein